MINEVTAKSILRKHKKIDSWFLSRYGMNLYRGCTHNCSYCDGRDEGYYVPGEFGRDIEVKINAPEIIDKELNPARKRSLFTKGFVMLGGGVCDGYQPVEEKYQLTRKCLELVLKYNFPVQLLTKSILVKRDADLIEEIQKKSGAIVSFSFSSCDDKISIIFEPGVPSPTERLETIKFLTEKNIPCGMFLMPVIPYVTDSNDLIEESIVKAKNSGAQFIIFSGMTLKPGRQKDHFYKILDGYNPALKNKYESIYPPTQWGSADESYYHEISKRFHAFAKKHKMPVRMPLHLFNKILPDNDLVVVLLEHMDYLLKANGERSSFGYAAWSISQVKTPLSIMRDQIPTIKNVTPAIEKIIMEILDTKTCDLYKKLIGETEK